MLKIRIPSICENEQRYVLDIILGEFLGLAFEVEQYSGSVLELEMTGDIRRLTIDTSFFQLAEKAWLQKETLPLLPLKLWNPKSDGLVANLVEADVPVLFGSGCFSRDADRFHLGLDIFGSSFFMLSRYEELITLSRDSHGRFSAKSSVAFKGNFIERPIVNEYVEILWEVMSEIWPDLVRKKRYFRMLISCDVDHPYDLAGNSFWSSLRRALVRVFRDMNPLLAFYDSLNYFWKKFGSNRFDSYRNNIDWMILVNKEAGNVIDFNFIPTQTDLTRDDPTNFHSQPMSELFQHIITSGHKIGIHPGYNTFDSPASFEISVREFTLICSSLGIDPYNIGGRQHYLRYDVGITPQLWDSHGFCYDSSLGFAEKAGYRSGVCYEYSMYNLVERKKLHLKQRPLITMDSTIVSKTYEGLGFSADALNRFKKFKSITKQFNGDYTLLWHNSFFTGINSKKMYSELIANESSK